MLTSCRSRTGLPTGGRILSLTERMGSSGRIAGDPSPDSKVDWGTRLPDFKVLPGNLPEGKREDEGGPQDWFIEIHIPVGK